MTQSKLTFFILFCAQAATFIVSLLPQTTHSFLVTSQNPQYQHLQKLLQYTSILKSTPTNEETSSSSPAPTKVEPRPSAGLTPDYTSPEDAIIHIAPKAMIRLRELKSQQENNEIILRMGVRNGGCSGLSYAMDFSTRDAIQDDDAVDEYKDEGVVCVVDAKSMLYLYGLELDYSDELIGGGFKFFNPNAEESCGCGSSFGV